ncbi:MAG: hypothetical protein ACK4UX_11380 [Thiobacillus sp.]
MQLIFTEWEVIAKGTRDELVRQEFVRKDDLLPGDAGAPRKWRHTTTDPAGRTIKVYRMSTHQFKVLRDLSPDERVAYERDVERRREIKDAQRAVAMWPRSADAYRADVAVAFDYGSNMLTNVFCSGAMGGWRFDEVSMKQAKALLAELRALFETGSIVMDQTLRDACTPACIADTVRAADAAHADADFQRFMEFVK